MTLTLPWKDTELPTYKQAKAFLLQRDYLGWSKLVWDKHKIFQFWNKEYIQGLSNEILKISSVNSLVLEVCAGNGQLTHWLKQHGINITATDNFERKIIPQFSVEKLDALSAIKKYNPTIVITSWIEYGYKIDIEILKTKVKFFILIGESEGGCTGSEEFWKVYQKLGYSVEYLDKVDKYNLCRTDYSMLGNNFHRHSSTALFKLVS